MFVKKYKELRLCYKQPELTSAISHRKVITSRCTRLGCLGPFLSVGTSGSDGFHCASRVSRSRSFLKQIKMLGKIACEKEMYGEDVKV